jgi:hypothetical protein
MAGSWDRREQPILDAIARGSEAEDIRSEQLCEATGLSTREVQIGLRHLAESGYITGSNATSQGEIFDLINIRLLERGLIATGEWPGDPYDELVTALTRAAASEADPEKRSKLERLVFAAGDVGKSVLSGVLTSVIKSTAGLRRRRLAPATPEDCGHLSRRHPSPECLPRPLLGAIDVGESQPPTEVVQLSA